MQLLYTCIICGLQHLWRLTTKHRRLATSFVYIVTQKTTTSHLLQINICVNFFKLFFIYIYLSLSQQSLIENFLNRYILPQFTRPLHFLHATVFYGNNPAALSCYSSHPFWNRTKWPHNVQWSHALHNWANLQAHSSRIWFFMQSTWSSTARLR